MTYIYAYLSVLLLFLPADFAWLGAMTSRLYRPTLGDILLDKVSIAPAIVFYLAYPMGIVIFAVMPALKGGTLAQAALYGALFGAFSYGTYDLTNQATLRNWSTTLTVVDMAWGSILGAFAAAGAFWIVGKLAN